MSNATYGSVLTCIIFSSILILFIFFASHNRKFILHNGVDIIYISILLVIIRMFLPFNFNFAINIRSHKILPAFFDLFHIEIFSIRIMTYLVYIAFIGSAVQLFTFIRKQYLYHKFISIHAPIHLPEIDCILSKITKEHNLKHSIKIIYIPEIESPAIIGLFRPVILLPRLDYRTSDLEYILAHEMQHFFHHDFWMKLLCEIMVCVYWWNPLAYLLRHQLRDSLEFSNDYFITKTMTEPDKLNYLQSLLNMAKQKKKTTVTLPVLHFFEGNPSCLERRFSLLTSELHPKKSSKWFNYLLIFSLLIFSLCFCFEPYSVPKEDHGAPVFEKPTPKNTFFIITKSKRYDMYVNHQKVGYLDSIDGFESFKIYRNKKEALKHETIQKTE